WGAGGTAFCTGCDIRAQLAAANTGGCRADGVCSSFGVATSGSNVARVESGLTGGNGWINHAAFVPAPCIGGTPNPGGNRAAPCLEGAPNPGANPAAPCGAPPGPFFPRGPPFFGEGSLFPGAGRGFGNSGVGIIMGPGQHNWDISLIKHTKITEKLNTEFRAEFYNVWNHSQFNLPSNNFGSPSTLGVITSSS